MKPLFRAAIILACAGLLCRPVFGQRTPPPVAPVPVVPVPPTAGIPDRVTEDAFSPPADSRLAVKLDAAAEYIHDEEWAKAARVLQQVLDLDGDWTAVIGGEKHPRTVSARAEALRLLASLPPAGRRVYQEAQGPRAAGLLRDAIKDKDDEKLSQTVRRFLYTDAGPDALAALAGLRYDAGRYRLAALSYSKLVELRDPAPQPPETLLRAANAFRRIGDKARAEAVGKSLLDRIGDDGLRVGDRKLSREDVRKELSQPFEASADWPVFGGDGSRTAQGQGGMPFLWRQWLNPTTISASPDHTDFGARLTDLFKTASDQLARANQPVLPPQFPVTATITMKRDGKQHSLVVHRTHAGIGVADIAGGKLLGFAPIKGSLDWMMSDPGRMNAMTQWTQAYMGQGQRPGIVFENTTIGTVSTDGDFAYTVEDNTISPPANFRMNMGFPSNPNPWGWPPDLVSTVEHSRLVAYDLSSGCKTAWEAPLPGDSKSELTESYFLGPPLPLDGRLFVLNEKQQELRLVCLESVKADDGARKPQVDFLLPLGTVHDGLSGKDVLRRLHAAQLAYADGVLVCPTEAGAVVGVDLLTRSIAWVYRYQERKAPAAGFPAAPAPHDEWVSGAPVVSGGAVVVAPLDGEALYCLDLKTGDLRWKEPRGEDGLYLAGVFDGRVVVVGKTSCRAYNLSDGKPLWAVRTGMPSGRGAAAGGVYYLPLREGASSKEPEVCAIDVAKGDVVGRARMRGPDGGIAKAQPLGNILFADGVLISQTTEEVVAYPLLKAKLQEIDALLAKNPGDVDGLVGRAELRLEDADAAGAVDDLHKAIESKPDAALAARAKGVLYEAFTQLLHHDFTACEKYLKEYDELCHVEGDAAETARRRANLYLLTGRGFEAEGKLKEALDVYASLAGLGDEPLLPSPDDPAVRVRPSVLGRDRIDALLQKATPEQRKALEEQVRKALKDAKE